MSKIAAAVLAALLLIVSSNLIIGAKTASGPNQPIAGYTLPTNTATADAPAGEAAPTETAGAGGTAAQAPAAAGFDAKAVVVLLASAKPEDGAAAFKKCAACHQVKKEAPSAVAPNMWGIVNRSKAAQADYAAMYSDALKAKGGEWTYESLALFLHQPRAYVPGTKMVFNGIKDPAEIAGLIAYLRTLADSPAPLPN